MYIRARKLADLLGGSTHSVAIAELEVEALCVTLNALSLLVEKNPWLVVPSTTVGTRVGPSRVFAHSSNQRAYTPQHPRKRRRLNDHIPADRLTEGQKDVDVITFDDIQQEYVHCIATLELLRRDAALISAGGESIFALCIEVTNRS